MRALHCCPLPAMRAPVLSRTQGTLRGKAAAAPDVDGLSAQREAELSCVSSEMAGWLATDQRINTLTPAGAAKEEEGAMQEG